MGTDGKPGFLGWGRNLGNEYEIEGKINILQENLGGNAKSRKNLG